MVPLTDFVLRTRLPAAAAQWQRRDPAFADLTMHVNVSGNDIVAHRLRGARDQARSSRRRLQPQHLTLELTENILMARLEAALPTLTELRRLGVRPERRRLRHRLFVAQPPVQPAGRQPEDRSLVRARPAARLEGGRGRARHRAAGQLAGQGRHRRRHRDRSRSSSSCATWAARWARVFCSAARWTRQRSRRCLTRCRRSMPASRARRRCSPRRARRCCISPAFGTAAGGSCLFPPSPDSCRSSAGRPQLRYMPR